jgi:uncharacterized membrane protein YkgB
MTLFEPREPDQPDHRQPQQFKRLERVRGGVYLLGVVAIIVGVLYLMGMLMGD